jgi:hypothetical protein
MDNIFFRAAKAKLRFPGPNGDLTTEQLFDLDLQSPRKAVDLDRIAVAVSVLRNNAQPASFISVNKRNTEANRLDLMMEVVLAVINHKQVLAANSENEAERAQVRQRALAALEQRELAEMSTMSAAELRRLAGK